MALAQEVASRLPRILPGLCPSPLPAHRPRPLVWGAVALYWRPMPSEVAGARVQKVAMQISEL
jgi:hypothetical protein